MNKPVFNSQHFDEGLRLFKQQRVSQALVQFRRAAEECPNWPHAHHNIADCLRVLGRKQEAVAAYRKVLVINPRFVKSMSDLALVLGEIGQVDEALTLRKEVIVYAAKGKQYAYYNYAALLAEMGQTNEAIENYQASIAASSAYAPAHYNLGLLLDKQNRLEEAERCYRKALSTDPVHTNALYMLALNLSKQEKAVEAMPLWEEYLTYYPNDSSALANLAVCVLARSVETENHYLRRRCLPLIIKALWHNPINIRAWLLLKEYQTP